MHNFSPDSASSPPDSAQLIDRTGPTRRPRRWPVMRQNWRDLLFLHWPVSPEILRLKIPRQLELDLFDGVAYLGLVPFTMTGVRPVGLPPVWRLSSFHETNLRTYVRLPAGEPGVWFFNLEAASSIAVRLARRFFYLPYHRARMFLEREPTAQAENSQTLVYAGVRCWPEPLPASYCIRAAPEGPVHSANPGTLDFFLFERYILYSATKTHLYQGRVYHSPYPIQSANLISLDETLITAAGLVRPEATPLAHFSSGVDVEVFRLRRLTS
jgi:uncharacterized protein YqjF (DUF2071 family)